jgi:dihydrofolate reductase
VRIVRRIYEPIGSADLEGAMRKLIVSAFISLDGVMQAPGGPKEDTSGEFRFGGWQVPYADEAIGRFVQDLHSQPFDLLLGRHTYDIWAAYWPHVPSDSGSRAIADLFNSVPKHVATHRPDTLDWQNSHALQGNLADAVRALKRKDGADLLTWGSSEVVRQLLAVGLVDDLRLLIHPIILGHGKRLFDEDAQASALTLEHSAITAGGVVITRYVRAGEVRTGSFEEGD